jgi:hypothetical protein
MVGAFLASVVIARYVLADEGRIRQLKCIAPQSNVKLKSIPTAANDFSGIGLVWDLVLGVWNLIA